MSTTLIDPKKKGTNPDRLTNMELMFVNEMAADKKFNATSAARKAGYKAASVAGNKLLKKPKIKAALGKVLYERLDRCEVTQDEVLQYIHRVVFFNPLDYFSYGEDGKWNISDPDSIPREIGCMIEKVRGRRTTNEDGSVEEWFEVELVSKSVAMGLLAKHCGIDQGDVLLRLDFNTMWSTGSNGKPDPIEQQIIDVEKEQE